MSTAEPTPASDSEKQPDSLIFLQAVLRKDAKALLPFGIAQEVVTAITLAEQINVARLLLASDNTKTRAISKRVLAAEVLNDKNSLPSKKPPQKPATFLPQPSLQVVV